MYKLDVKNTEYESYYFNLAENACATAVKELMNGATYVRIEKVQIEDE